MKLYAVSMMKDEDDIADLVLYHLTQQGVDGIIVADNLSTDRTKEKLFAAKDRIQSHPQYSHVDIEITDDTEVAYKQDFKMTNLAQLAGSRGATWIIPFDADELWFSNAGTLAEGVLRAEGRGCRTIVVPYWDHRVTAEDAIGDPFSVMGYRKEVETNVKTAFKYESHINISNGSHFIYFHGNPSLRDENPCRDELYIRHFGQRSRTQFIKKFSNAYKACKALPSNSDLYNGAGWNYYFQIYEAGGEEALGARFDVDWKGTDGLVYDPAKIVPWYEYE